MKLYRVVRQRWEKSPAYPFGHWAQTSYLPVALPHCLAELRCVSLNARRRDDSESYFLEATR